MVSEWETGAEREAGGLPLFPSTDPHAGETPPVDTAGGKAGRPGTLWGCQNLRPDMAWNAVPMSGDHGPLGHPTLWLVRSSGDWLKTLGLRVRVSGRPAHSFTTAPTLQDPRPENSWEHMAQSPRMWRGPLPRGRRSPTIPRPSCRTRPGAIVGDEAGHVHVPAVDGQVPHAAHKLPVLHREVFGQVGDAPQEQGACQIQGPVEATPTSGWPGGKLSPDAAVTSQGPLPQGTLVIPTVNNPTGAGAREAGSPQAQTHVSDPTSSATTGSQPLCLLCQILTNWRFWVTARVLTAGRASPHQNRTPPSSGL